MSNSNMKRAAVISGGGSFGAYMAGLIAARKVEYDLVAGTSTGALMSPYVALQAYDRLYFYYTTVQNNDIYNVDPFTRKGKLNLLKAVWRMMRKKRTLGETENLRKLLKQEFIHSDFLKLRELGKEVIVSATNISKRPYKTEYFSNFKESYEDFVDFIWASTLVPGISSILTKNGYEYTDGGVMEATSILHVIQKGCTHIDMYLHKQFPRSLKKQKVKDIPHNLIRHFNVIREDNHDDLNMAIKLFEQSKVEELNLYFLPSEFQNHNAARFHPVQMETWYHLGMSNARNSSLIKTYTHEHI